MADAHGAALIGVAALYLCIPLRLLWQGTMPLPHRTSPQGLQYHWYLRCMVLVGLLSGGVCGGIPVAVVAGQRWPCAVVLLVRFVLPSLTIGLVLLAHASVLASWTSVALVAQLRDPASPSPLVLRQLRTLRSLQSPRTFLSIAVGVELLLLAPYVFVDTSILALDVAACSRDGRFQGIVATQLVQSGLAAFLALPMLLRYRSTHDDPAMGFYPAYVRSMCAVLGANLVVILVVAAPPAWGLAHLDDVAVGLLQLVLSVIFVHSHRQGNRVLALGPHISSLASQAVFEVDKASTLDDLQAFLADADHYEHFLRFCKGRGRVTELLAWKLVTHFQHETVPAAVVLAECFGPRAALCTLGCHVLPRHDCERALEVLGDRLLQHLAEHELPGYRKSAKLWDVFVQRAAIIKRYQQPRQPTALAESASNLALRASSELDSGGRMSHGRTSSCANRSLRLGDIVTPEALGLPAATIPPSHDTEVVRTKDRRVNVLTKQATQDILRGIQQQCAP
ncbi:hypothetical protein ACHHYP_07552 [Achlya hypogyna]|uniref:RGS domain-containing protein n=1 Tax=Achlya hypogyna TaxID=1202772 RepID=A0A1V9YQP9_ACHHY|nr:hypothetical protein ACHHYP_07552 [Achlya hypogyna]